MFNSFQHLDAWFIFSESQFFNFIFDISRSLINYPNRIIMLSAQIRAPSGENVITKSYYFRFHYIESSQKDNSYRWEISKNIFATRGADLSWGYDNSIGIVYLLVCRSHFVITPTLFGRKCPTLKMRYCLDIFCE